MRKPLVYISSPFSKGDQILNLKKHTQVFNQLFDLDTVLPIAPLFNTLAHMDQPRNYESWIEYDLEILGRCDAVFVLDESAFPEIGYCEKESSGRDLEIKCARALGLPVFYKYNVLDTWARRG